MCLPKYCWVCCWNMSVDSGAKFFAMFRLMIAVFQILSILEALVTARLQHGFESSLIAAHDTNFNTYLKELGIDDDDFQGGSDIAEATKQWILTIAMLLLASSLLYSLIELIVASLAIHGMRKDRPNMLLPYIIWTSFIAFIAFAVVALLVVLFAFVMSKLDEARSLGHDEIEIANVEVLCIVVFIIFGITFGLTFAWILWDLLIMSSRHRQLKNSNGMDHIMLQEVPNEEKEKMLYPQLT